MKKNIIWLVVSCLMALALLAAACAPAPAKETTPVAPAVPATQEASSTEVEISGSAFVPATITIAVGTTVTWTNKHCCVHTVSSQGTLFDSGNLSNGATFSYTFNQKCTFEYHCKIHPAMTGKVVVGEEDSGSATKNGNGAAGY